MMHTDLKVYQESILLVKDIYNLTKDFPKDEQWGLVSQMKRAVISVPSNIAEGSGRKTRNELNQFLNIAMGSLTELDTHLEIAGVLGFVVDAGVLTRTKNRLDEVKRMLAALQRSLTAPSPS
ncbi:MAG: four helix bundle protein [Candidatus Cloacimonetes bacterium HGW-Cloacimonetes-2]|jgi:four helix bundle protein|nr:MAG: four helix bundle protein [Candidatus Cloacimonetes bacterium HGW-Cloacimonetes-2]